MIENFRKKLFVISLVIIISISSCINDQPGNPTIANIGNATSTPVNTAKDGTLTVLAAASLTDAFKEIGSEFEKANPGTHVVFSFAGSQILGTQLEQGAVADIFASADTKNMNTLSAEGLVNVNSDRVFATNHLVVILPPGNPRQIKSLADLTMPGLKFILADSSVPAGDYARIALENLDADPTLGADYSSRVLANLVSNETDVRQVVTKVELGEADAGIVYASDAISSPDLGTIEIPSEYNIIAQYPIAILNGSHDADLAARFITYVTSPAGNSILTKWGFSKEP